MRLQEQISRIKSVMGLITEQKNNWNKCNKCIGNYQGSLDKCGFYAIERFEENYGTSSGGSMGDDYFENNYQQYDKIINDRLSEYIPNAWSNMSPKMKMQLWNFMFNSDSGTTDKFRWLAILYLTANTKIKEFDEPTTMKIIGSKGSSEWNDAVELVNQTTNWNYYKFLDMVKGQYGTYSNISALQSTWSYRADALHDMYDDCISGIDPAKTNTKSTDKSKSSNATIDNNKTTKKTIDSTPKIIEGKSFEDLRNKLSGGTKNISINEFSIKFDVENLTVKFNTGKTKIKNMSLVYDNSRSEQVLTDRIKELKRANPTYTVIKQGGKNDLYWWVLAIIK
jgi:hypothetical protein